MNEVTKIVYDRLTMLLERMESGEVAIADYTYTFEDSGGRSRPREVGGRIQWYEVGPS